MSLIFSEFIVGRIDEIASDLRKTNAEYALAIDKSSRYYESLEPIIMSTTEEYTISRGDCLNLKEFLDEELSGSRPRMLCCGLERSTISSPVLMR